MLSCIPIPTFGEQPTQLLKKKSEGYRPDDPASAARLCRWVRFSKTCRPLATGTGSDTRFMYIGCTGELLVTRVSPRKAKRLITWNLSVQTSGCAGNDQNSLSSFSIPSLRPF